MKVVITGATGSVGKAVLSSLRNIDHQLDLYAGVRNVEADKISLEGLKTSLLKFDFMDFKTCEAALENCDILFLLRPPQISDTEKYFKPIIDACQDKGVKHIVFLSVQGVENSRIIPHHKIEKMIVGSKINYTFLRPAYFMQNFTTTLRKDLVTKKQIFLPAGESKFTLIDVMDIGEVAANILINIKQHINESYDLTNGEKLTFSQMAKILSNGLGTQIKFQSPNLMRFFLTKRKENMPTMFILVMIMLHYFPRFQKEPETTDWVAKITGRQPRTFAQFISENRNLLT
ncbi:NmrA family NAD(P)-binding protein [Aquiflexum gelatinilyticum]|uniref:NmrA family NAD(P)-binding protein n=1 Tax=Aquiflexum gelatinilyticum TaxID=2961943 RepID=A0A9X2P4S9_9BACT|nr:NmrA family NAD(P)-binding protein [Aquiflexum gelatinilyticum]MCR9013497.1 NmrA family NAD(P)-binding protein [Aquiflexum gelatinilyticum]